MAGPKSDKLWADAVRRAVLRETEIEEAGGTRKKVQYIHVIAGILAKQAAEGDMAAIREIGDRLDGKPAQAIEASGNVSITLSASDKAFL